MRFLNVDGLGVAVNAAASPRELFALKGRPAGKAVAWLVEGPAALDRYGDGVHPWVHRLARRFWPGGLTLVVRASEAVPPAFRSPEGTIGLRMPAAPEALALIGAVGSPLAGTSANPTGAPAPADGVASTVVDCTAAEPVVLRPGLLTARDLKECSHE